ncbi:MAG: hypothetical protein ABGZ23_10890 [Fuerstiella sp.]
MAVKNQPYERGQPGFFTIDGESRSHLSRTVGKLNSQITVNVRVPLNDKAERRELTTSIMPAGLLHKMNANEIRDLIAYLLQESES